MNRKATSDHLVTPTAVSFASLLLASFLLVGTARGDGNDPRGGDAVMAQRRAYVESLSPAEKDDLRRNQQRFSQLDEAGRQKLRDLHAEISTNSNRDRLTSVLRLYHQWMQSLTAGERLELMALPADQRIKAIKKLIERQERERFQELAQKPLSVQDREAIVDWLAELALRKLPAVEQARLRAIEPPLRQRMEVMAVFRRRTGGISGTHFLERLDPTTADQQALMQQLSRPAQNAIAAANSDAEKRRLVQSWVNAAILSRRENRPMLAKPTLDAFLESLDAAEKDYLNNLPPDRKREELERLYWRSGLRRPGEFRPPFGPKRRRGG